MNVEASSLPTDSLYKMLTIGGLVLVIGGIAIGWKAIDETQTSLISLSEAETALAGAAVPVQLQYKSICNACRDIERSIELAIAGVNVDALNELKGGQPSGFPTLGESLSSSHGGGTEWGTTEPPVLSSTASVSEWLATSERIESHLQSAMKFLTAPGLKVISPELKAESIRGFESVQPMVAELEDKAIALSAPQQLLASAKNRHQLAEKRQRIISAIAAALFCVGIAVFARASINWYGKVQRYEDAILRDKAKDLPIENPVSLLSESLWVSGFLGVSIALWMLTRVLIAAYRMWEEMGLDSS